MAVVMLLVSSYRPQKEREKKEYWRLAGFPQLAQERVFSGISDSPAIDCKELKARVAEEGMEMKQSKEERGNIL